MHCIAWNYCWLGKLRTSRELVEIIWVKYPSIVFLAETLVDVARLEVVQRCIDFDHCWVVPREGKGGGWVLFWKLAINLTAEDLSKNFINAFIDKNSENEWRLVGFYGEPNTARRFEVWNRLRDLNSHPETPWLCVDDFNEISKQVEKFGGGVRPHNQM